MKTITTTSIFILFSVCSFAQPVIQWQNTIGGNFEDYLNKIVQTSDGGYILAGYSNSDSTGDKTENPMGDFDFWIVKTDSIGNVQWENTIGGNDYERANCIKQTADGGYIIGGETSSNQSPDKAENCLGMTDCWIVKLDSSGNIQWENTLGGSSYDDLFAMDITYDGGYILGCTSISGISADKSQNSKGSYDYWIVKLDSSGNKLWDKTIGGWGEDYLRDIQQLPDHGYIIGGSSASSISADKTENCRGQWDYWVMQLDSTGAIQWQKTVGGNDGDFLYSFLSTADGGYIMGGDSYSGISGDKTENSYGLNDMWVVKIDPTGNIQWQLTLGGTKTENLFSMQQMVDGSYLLGGTSGSPISGNRTENTNGVCDYWLIDLDSSGNILWQKDIGGIATEYLKSLALTSDQGFIIGGYSASMISGDKTEGCIGVLDYWIIKFAPFNITGIGSFQDKKENAFMFPNPVSKWLYLTLQQKEAITIINTVGQNVYTETNTSTGKNILNVETLSPGIYFIKAGNTTLKFVKE